MNALSPVEINRKAETLIPEKPLLHPELNETQLVLKRALELLGPNGEHWCGENDPKWARKDAYCLWLATTAVVNRGSDVDDRTFDARVDAVTAAVGAPPKNLDAVFAWNDSDGRTFADVKAAFERAIELAA